jgi:uncharacterized membrane protein
MESTLFKIKLSKKHSGIFYGPMTAVYGVGIISIELLNKYFFKKIKCNKILKLIIEFLTLTIILSLIEYLGGNILNYLFDIDMWDYSNIKPNFGKYICLQNSIIWGILGTIYIHIFKPFTDKLINQITTKESYLFLTIFIIDTILVLVTKL